MIDMAFPAHWNMFPPQTGMTLRDYFAAKAMHGDMVGGVHQSDFEFTAQRAYLMADAMLKARDE